MWCFLQYTTPLHIVLHLTCSVVCCTLPCHAYLNRTCIILDCASCHAYACWFTMLFVSFRVASLVSFGFVPELWGFVRLHPFVFFMDSFFFLAGFQARWPHPQNHFYLCLLVVRSFCHAALPTTCYIMPAILPCPASNHSFLANRCLAKLPLLLSPSYSVASCRWSEVGSMLEHGYFWNITISLI